MKTGFPSLISNFGPNTQPKLSPPLEKLVGTLYQERSRKSVGSFGLSQQISGYWDRSDTEIDLVAVAEDDKAVRLISAKRSPDKLVADLPQFDGHCDRFLAAIGRFKGWKVEKVAIAPTLDAAARAAIVQRGYIPEDLVDLTSGLTEASAAAEGAGAS